MFSHADLKIEFSRGETHHLYNNLDDARLYDRRRVLRSLAKSREAHKAALGHAPTFRLPDDRLQYRESQITICGSRACVIAVHFPCEMITVTSAAITCGSHEWAAQKYKYIYIVYPFASIYG